MAEQFSFTTWLYLPDRKDINKDVLLCLVLNEREGNFSFRKVSFHLKIHFSLWASAAKYNPITYLQWESIVFGQVEDKILKLGDWI